MLIRKIILLCVSVLYINLICAQEDNYKFAQLDLTAGLSNNQINCIYKDAQGFMWFGTVSGLNRYDGYTFKVFHHIQNDSASMLDESVQNITSGPSGKLWVQTINGFSIYNPVTERFDITAASYLKSLSMPSSGLTTVIKWQTGYWFVFADSGLYYCRNESNADNVKPAEKADHYVITHSISSVAMDHEGFIWIVYRNGVLEKFDPVQKRVILSIAFLQDFTHTPDLMYQIYIDSDDDCWFYGRGEFPDLYFYKPKENTFKRFSNQPGAGRLNNNIVNAVIEDTKGMIWVATDHGGINILNKKTYCVQVIENKPYDNTYIAQNSINALYKDNLGIVWAGTFKHGISYYHESAYKFRLYRHQPTDDNSLAFDDINKFIEDPKGNIWVGTNGGGLIYFDRKANTFKQFKHDSANINSLCNDVIVTMMLDHSNKLWIGTYFGGLDCFDGKTFTHYKHNNTNPNSIADDRVWEIYEDSYMELWIGTFGKGLDRLDRQKNIFYHYPPGAPNSVHARYITQITEDVNKDLWLATAFGVDRYERNANTFIHYSASENGLSNDNVISTFLDSKKNLWFGTGDGLCIYNRSKNNFQDFNSRDGLPNNTIQNILEDNDHNIWISTSNGIAKISYSGNDKDGYKISSKNYDELDGLQGREFNENAALKTKDGQLIFGGPYGFNIFNPSEIKSNKNVPVLVFTGLQVFNNPINADTKINGHAVLKKAITETDAITLKYNENVFSIEFAALSFINTEKNKYIYKLENFNKDWLATDGNSRKVTYTNLDPGEYTFRVKASNDDGVWNENGIAVKIIILPPLWETPIAYILYIIIIAAILYFARRLVIQRAQMRFALEQERNEAQRMHELDLMKIRFFTNVSHEFRTPLSLILTPLERMIRSAPEPAQKKQYQLIHRNARRLLNMVNQLLDFRKMEVQELKLSTSKGDIAAFIKSISYSFTDIAENKHISFSYSSTIEQFYTKFDHDKIERILFNLLSNAFKFTGENGMVTVHLNAKEKGNETQLEITVKDTGIGIPANKINRIFDRFFQHEVPGTMVNQGSGIGLAITKEFVKLHHGTISVESEENKGSCFTLRLPFKKTDVPVVAETVADEEPEDQGTETLITLQEPVAVNINKKYAVLLVEDNEDFLTYLKDNLCEYYNISVAKEGKEGWQKTLSTHPDLVVSDISMPVMNGIELCRKIKNDARTKHIPVVLLTALEGEQQQLLGLETGAADYMTKPFNFEILISRIKNLLSQQQSLKKTFTRQVEVKTTEIKVDTPEEAFVKEALTITEKNMANDRFSVEELSRGLHMSRVAVYKRLFAYTGKTPIEFIRAVRLQRALQLLQKTQMTIAEVAYETGFNNPKYFAKYFRAQYGMLPSAYQASLKAAAQKVQEKE